MFNITVSRGPRLSSSRRGQLQRWCDPRRACRWLEEVAQPAHKYLEVLASPAWCCALLWISTATPWFRTSLSGDVVPVGLALLLISMAVPQLQFLASSAAVVLSTLHLCGPGAVFKSAIGVLSFGKGAVPLGVALSLYALAALLWTAKLVGCFHWLSFRWLARLAAFSCALTLAVLIFSGPTQPDNGLLLAVLGSAHAYRHAQSFDDAPNGYNRA